MSTFKNCGVKWTVHICPHRTQLETVETQGYDDTKRADPEIKPFSTSK